jgi:serine/threonine-protein kinase HipA
LIGNTDDHLKNFWMIFGQSEGWRLSPAFDLVPNITQRSEHVLIFEHDPQHPERTALTKLGRTWGISNSKEIVEKRYAVVAGWNAVFSSAGMRD